jgi:hypothetical protein
MEDRVSKTKFKANALEFFRQIEVTGKPIVITHRGHPTLEVRPYSTRPVDVLAALHGSVLRYDHPTAPVAEGDWEANSDYFPSSPKA